MRKIKCDTTLQRHQLQKKIVMIQYRYAPYLLIMLFTCGMSLARVYLIPEWNVMDHVMGFLSQTAGMIGIWHLVKWVSGRLDKIMPFEEGPLTRIVFQQAVTLLLLSPIVVLSLVVSKPHFPGFVNKQMVAIAIILFIVIVALFNFSFYAAYFFKNWQMSVQDKADLEIQAARLEKEKMDLQYHQLRNQVNPHYLFNTLTSLDGLIHTNPDLASEFVRHMSKVYRYVLQHKESEVVSLYEELDFIQHYIKLLHIRYGDGLCIAHHISPTALDKGIVMVTLQMLIDNAVKHNIVQSGQTLHVHISDVDDCLVIHNNKQLRKQIETSNGEGLKQLKQLYSFLTPKEIVIEDTNECYTIKMPLL